jgi:hypothetical protein
VIETASITAHTLPDDVVRAKLRNAPPTIKARVDVARQERGLTPLFTEKAIVRSAPVAFQPPRPKVARTLVGVAAPGVSVPCTIREDSTSLPEIILPSAWDDVGVDLRAGRHLTITDGHGGKVIARSGDPTFRWRIDSKVGLLWQLDLLRANDVVWPGPMGCSIGMKPLKWSHQYKKYGWVRCIESMRLDHIALLRPSQRRDGAYDLARVRSAKPGEASSVATDLWLETLRKVL